MHWSGHSEKPAWDKSRTSNSSRTRGRAITAKSGYANLAAVSLRKHETGSHQQVVEQHSLRERDSGQEDGQHLLPANGCKIGGRQSEPPCMLLKTGVVGQSLPSLFSRDGVASPGTPGEGT